MSRKQPITFESAMTQLNDTTAMGTFINGSFKHSGGMSFQAMRMVLDVSRARIDSLESQNEHLRHTLITQQAKTSCMEELCDLMPIGYLRLDQKGLILDANRAAVKLMGTYRTNLRLKSLARFVSNDHKSVYRQFLDRVVASELVSTCEVKLQPSRGQEYWVKLTSSWAPLPFKDTQTSAESKDSRALIVMINDITELKQYEANLREQTRQLKNVLNNLPSMIGYWDKDLRNKFGNHAYATWFGVDPQYMPGKHIREVIGEERYELNLPHIEAALKGEYREFERDIPSPNGSIVRHSWAQYIPDVVDGEVAGFLVQVTDITHAKDKERALIEAQRIGHVGSYNYDVVKDQWTSSPELDRIFGFETGSARSIQEWVALIPSPQRGELSAYWRDTLTSGSTFDIEYPIIRANDHEPRLVHGIGEVMRSQDNAPLRMVGSVQDITERRAKELQLTSQLAAMRLHIQALNQISQGVMITGLDCTATFVNEAFEVITGYSSADILGKTCKLLHGPLSQVDVIQKIRSSLVSARPFQGEIINYRKDGTLFWNELTITPVFDDHGTLIQFVGVQRDISPRKASANQIYQLAFYDALTGTPNRSLLISKLQSLITDPAKQSDHGALLSLDLDRFKLVNETLGHAQGDKMLIEASRRIQSCLRNQDTVAHVGGDEYMVLCDGLAPSPKQAMKDVAQMAESIREALAHPFDLNGQEFLSSASIGAFMFRVDEVTTHDVLKRSDIAMYRAKSSGRNTVRFFDAELQTEQEKQTALESDLRRAVRDKKLDLHFQIQVDDNQRPIGAEVLVRWNHGERGMISPSEFIPLAEQSLLIHSLGRWVLESACRQLGEWSHHENTRQLSLAVNISANQFSSATLVEDIADMLLEFGVKASRLKLELTESVVLNDIDDVIGKMHGLKALGVTLSMDDFGTGYSSLSYLKRLPVDQIKIDQSFIRGITTEQSDYVMVKTIIEMAKNFRLNVIAEGVETEAQRSLLKYLGCESYQGSLFGEPLPIAKFSALLLKPMPIH
jgi:diguanylate cyclase (GGDEF)-like protein/PAS domain S-box-containing protein